MQKQWAIGALMSAALIAFSGCPLVVQVEAGNWVFYFYDLDENGGALVLTAGIRLNEDGSTEEFLVDGESLQATTRWWQIDESFTLEQVVVDPYWSTAEVMSSTHLGGTVRNVNNGVPFLRFAADWVSY